MWGSVRGPCFTANGSKVVENRTIIDNAEMAGVSAVALWNISVNVTGGIVRLLASIFAGSSGGSKGDVGKGVMAESVHSGMGRCGALCV